jgi:hypothetical protein
MSDSKATQRLVTTCGVPGVHRAGDDNPRDPDQNDGLTVDSDPSDPDCVTVRIGNAWVRVRAKLLKLAADHASETAPKW